MPKATTQNPPEQFATAVADALKHYNDAGWLGQHSPLATPYFLGSFLQQESEAERSEGRGHGLRRAIEQAAASIWPGELPQSKQSLLALVEQERAAELYGPRYLFLLLDLRYLRRYFLPSSAPNTVGAMYDLLNVSETRFFAHLKIARDRLAQALLRITRPSLRLESPLPPVLIGRDRLIERCSADFQINLSLTISGQAGIGKTSLGAHLAHTWPSGAAFWHTFRPGLNDDLASVVFGLAHFLHQHGCSALWLQLMANESILDNLEQLAGFLREDLHCAAELPVLLCFDELDLLHTSSDQPRHGVHRQVLELLESLRGQAPLLFIAQRGLLVTERHYELAPLTLEETAQFLRRENVDPPEGIERVQRLTGGNPRFLEIYSALRTVSDPYETIVLGRSPSIKPVFNRLWKHLDEDEKQVLTALSAYRSMAPIDVWHNNPALQDLQDRNLLKIDTRGGVAILPLFREIIYEELTGPQRCMLHQESALVRAERGQYTEAAHHLWQAELFAEAINLWYENQDVEIEQGKAGAAYALFNSAKPMGLEEASAKRLKVVRDRLSLLHGDAASVLEDIDSYSWHLDEKITAEALDQWGRAHTISGDADQALDDYDRAITVLGELAAQIVQLHRTRGQIYLDLAAPDRVRREISLAQYEIEWLKALMEIIQGRFLAAQDYLESARQIAETMSDARRMAKADQFIAMAAGNHGDYTRARRHALAAMDYFKQTGDRLSQENMRAELAGFFLNEGRFAEAIEPSEDALRFFENIKHELRIAFISSNLAEAYFETGDLQRAESYAMRAIQSENPRIQPYACYTLAQVRHRQGRVNDAEHVFQTGLGAARQSGDEYIAAYLHRAYGEMLCHESKYTGALDQLQTGCDLFSKLQMTAELEKTEQLLAKCGPDQQISDSTIGNDE
ncbi:MAG: hypothetical protein ACK2U5_14165 [Candidatus Promineifilaceae bacterium]